MSGWETANNKPFSGMKMKENTPKTKDKCPNCKEKVDTDSRVIICDNCLGIWLKHELVE